MVVVHFSSREELCCVVGTMQNFSKRSHRVGGGEEAADDRKQTNCVAEKRSLWSICLRGQVHRWRRGVAITALKRMDSFYLYHVRHSPSLSLSIFMSGYVKFVEPRNETSLSTPFPALFTFSLEV